MDTLAKRKLILEFMGIKPKLVAPDTYVWSDSPYYSVRLSTPEKVIDGIANYIEYEKSYGDLMPVVEKIETLLPKGYNILIEGNNCYIDLPNGTSIEINSNSKLEAIFDGVIDFILFYKKNNLVF
jgi:hypothetical protein